MLDKDKFSSDMVIFYAVPLVVKSNQSYSMFQALKGLELIVIFLKIPVLEPLFKQKKWGGKRNYDQWHTNLFTPFFSEGGQGCAINLWGEDTSSNCLNFNESLFLPLFF